MPAHKKYHTEEERKQALRQQNTERCRRYRQSHREYFREYHHKRYQAHREQRLEQQRQYDIVHGGLRSAVGYELLSADELEALSHASTDMSERVINEMDVDFTAQYMQQFKQMLLGEELTDELLEQAFKLARSSTASNGQKGRLFELVIRKNILYELRLHKLKLYSQVSINSGTCRIDFVISKQVCEDKRDLDISQAVIISTKTGLRTSWREDMHLYSQCQAYIMVSLDDKCPTEEVPDNVYFCSPHYTESTNKNIINLNSLLRTVMEYLDPETSDEDDEKSESES